MQPLPGGAVDLSAIKARGQARAAFEKAVAITVMPGDKILVILPREATPQDTQGFANFLKEQFPETDFIVVSGPEAVVRVPVGSQTSTAPQGGGATDAMPVMPTTCYEITPEGPCALNPGHPVGEGYPGFNGHMAAGTAPAWAERV